MRRALLLALALLVAHSTATLAAVESGSVTGSAQATAGGIAGVNASGSNVAGNTTTFTPGLATGTAAAGDFLVNDGFVGATGSTLQTGYERFRIVGKTTTLSTTTATATSLISMSTISNSSVGGEIRGVIDVEDGASHVSSVFWRQVWAASNRAGTVLATVGTIQVQVSDATTFTSVTTTCTAVVSGTAILLKVTPSWAAGTPTIVRACWSSQSYGPTTGTVQ